MRFMNDYDLEVARARFTRATCPNRLALVMVVDALREATDEVSDGWAYWSKPAASAASAMALIESRTHAENEQQETQDLTDAEVTRAVMPIKAMLTRNRSVFDAERRERILRAVTS